MHTQALLRWYTEHHRPLPWRTRPEPYWIWLSEIMAQQTRIDTMLAYWTRFTTQWPTVQQLAAAPLDEVLAAWSGLGYYTRARNLHAAAQQIAAQGGFPRQVDALRALPGVGEYTAGAIASIAFGIPTPVVDGNVERVLCRYFGLEEDPRQPAARRALWARAAALVPAERPGDHNQALMELGATVCTPRRPRCACCPIAEGCAARASGSPERLPNKPRTQRSPEVRGVCAAVHTPEGVLLAQRPPEGLLGGLWELPGAELAPGEEEPAALVRAFAERLGLRATPLARAGQVRHIFTHRKLTLGVWIARAEGSPAPLGYQAVRAVRAGDLAALGLSTLARRSLELVGLGPQPLLLAAEPGAGPR